MANLKGSALQEYLAVLNNSRGMTSIDVVNAREIMEKLTDEELMHLKQIEIAGRTDSARHAFNEFLNGLIEAMIRKRKLTWKASATLANPQSAKYGITLSGKEFPFLAREHHQSNDRGLKRRMLNDKDLVHLSLPKLFGKYLKTKNVIDAELIGVNMVEKVGEGWLLNGLIILVSEEDKRGYGLSKKPDLRISENSFVSSEETWHHLFCALEFFTPCILLREGFVVDGISSGKIFEDKQPREIVTPRSSNI